MKSAIIVCPPSGKETFWYFACNSTWCMRTNLCWRCKAYIRHSNIYHPPQSCVLRWDYCILMLGMQSCSIHEVRFMLRIHGAYQAPKYPSSAAIMHPLLRLKHSDAWYKCRINTHMQVSHRRFGVGVKTWTQLSHFWLMCVCKMFIDKVSTTSIISHGWTRNSR